MVERFWPKPDMDVAPDGPFVRFSDYETLRAELEAVKRERDRNLREAAKHFAKTCELADRALTAESRADKAAEDREAAKRLELAVAFTAKMAWRTDPPYANNKLTDSERLSAIKYHPTIKKYGEPHQELAEKEAALRSIKENQHG